MKRNRIEVKFQIKAVVSVVVKADDVEQAKELARERMNSKVFVKGIEAITENITYIGHDLLDYWDEVEE